MSDSSQPLYSFNIDYGFWGTRNYDRVIYYPEYAKSIRVQHDSNGNRASFNDCADGDFSKLSLFLGGSHTWGAGVQNNETFPALVEKLTKFKIHNLGHCSFGLDQMALVLETTLHEIKPDVVIVELHPWVIHRILRKSALGFPKPYFQRKKSLQLRKLSKLYQFKFLRKLVSDYEELAKEFQEYEKGIVLREVKTDFMDPIFHLWRQDYYEEMYLLTKDLVRHIQTLCRKSECRLIFVLGPTRQELENLESDLELINFSIPRNHLITILEDLDIEYLNLLPRFAELIKTGNESGLYSDGHLNESGHQIVANEIVRIMG